jgi:hypothetical protein
MRRKDKMYINNILMRLKTELSGTMRITLLKIMRKNLIKFNI